MAELTEQQRLDIKWAIDSLASRTPAYKLYDDYYNGAQKSLALASEQYNSAISFVQGFCENLCATVVDVVKDRLKLTDFTHDQNVEEVANDNLDTVTIDPTADKITEVWKTNRLDELQGEIYLETLKSGDGYALVWPDEQGIPRIDPNQAWLVTVQYSETKRGELNKAAKVWKGQDDFGRLNLYYPDRIEKFITTAKQSMNTGTVNPSNYKPLDEEPTIPNPYGQVPVFHFRNNAGVGKFGVSELKAAIPCQDRLNKTLSDSLVAGEELSLPLRYALGFEFPVDPRTGKPIMPFDPGDWWLSRSGKEVQIGQLEGAKLEQFISTAMDARISIARVTRTPLHYFLSEGTPPSGEMLKTAEAPLSSKIRDRQIAYGNTFEDLFRFCLKIMSTDARLEAVWANTMPRDDTAEIANQILKVESLGFSKRSALVELEYSPEEVDVIEKEKQDETESGGMIENKLFNAG